MKETIDNKVQEILELYTKILPDINEFPFGHESEYKNLKILIKNKKNIEIKISKQEYNFEQFFKKDLKSKPDYHGYYFYEASTVFQVEILEFLYEAYKILKEYIINVNDNITCMLTRLNKLEA